MSIDSQITESRAPMNIRQKNLLLAAGLVIFALLLLGLSLWFIFKKHQPE